MQIAEVDPGKCNSSEYHGGSVNSELTSFDSYQTLQAFWLTIGASALHW